LDNLFKQKKIFENNIINDAKKYINSLPNYNKQDEVIKDIIARESEIFKVSINNIEEKIDTHIQDEKELVKQYFKEILLNGGEEKLESRYSFDKGLLVVFVCSCVALWIKLFFLDISTRKHERVISEIGESLAWAKEKEEAIKSIARQCNEIVNIVDRYFEDK